MERLDNQQILAAGLTDWRKLAQALHARYSFPDYGVAAAFLASIAQVAEAEDHLDIKLSHSTLDVSLCTRDDGLWVTQKDVEMARKISEVAHDLGLRAEPTEVAQLEIALDTAHEERLSTFWSVLLTGSAGNTIDDSVFDPTGRVPNVWFQSTDEHGTPRQRWHFDLWLAPEIADQRIAGAVAAGGTVVDSSSAPSFTVLADPDGNKVCICTAMDR